MNGLPRKPTCNSKLTLEKMGFLQFSILYILIYRCYPERPCPKKCTCVGHKEKSQMDCSESELRYFPLLNEIPLYIGQIILENNDIQHFPEDTGTKLNTWAVDVSGNKIRKLEDNHLGQMFPKLSMLDLSKNQIKNLNHKSFLGLKLLKTLYLDNNGIDFIANDAFDNLTSLLNLNLAENKLEVLNFRWFENLKMFTSLDLSGNRIEIVKSWMHPWPSSLERVDLSNNRLPVILPIPKHAEMFNLKKNPIYCGCKPERFALEGISNQTLCKVKMQCNSIPLDGDCKNKQLSEEMYKFWKDLTAKPICQTPVIKRMDVVPGPERLYFLTCVASGIPAPNITLYSDDTEQKLQVYGVETTKITSATMNQLLSGVYHCKASNTVGRVSKKVVVDLNKIEMKDVLNSTYSNLNSTSPLPLLSTTFPAQNGKD